MTTALASLSFLGYPKKSPRKILRTLTVECVTLHAVMDGVDFTRSKLPAQLGGRTKDSYNPVTREEEKEGGYDEF
eukprot:COSAG02_NODE_14625_length_1253_cov_1.579723_1_plen_75_part_00